MKPALTTYRDAREFLARMQSLLEEDEVGNSLMLGVCLRLQGDPELTGANPYFATVEDGEGVALAAVATGNNQLILWSGRQDAGEAIRLLVSNLTESGRNLPGAVGCTSVADTLAAAWSRATGHKVAHIMNQRVCKLTRVIHPHYAGGRLRVATEADIDLVAKWLFEFEAEALSGTSTLAARTMATRKVQAGDMYLWEDGEVVSMAGKSRPTTNGITVNAVYTPPRFRGRGYATSCVASLSQFLLDSGWKFCTLNTDLANPTSNGIYQRIGYEPVCDRRAYWFE